VNPGLRRQVGEAWAFRARVEHDAAHRFTRLAGTISSFDRESPVIALMHRAAADEVRHAGLCEELAASYQHPVQAPVDPESEIAPAKLATRQAVLYEVVAACCITETESVATVATLLAEPAEPRVREILHLIARDEVVHGRMGWTHLAREAASTDVTFLSAWIPAMLAGTVDDTLFADAAEEEPADALMRHGVLPQARKREIFVGTLRDVVFPGLEKFGIDLGPARAWLDARAPI
jgi:hypothetical protein